MWFILPTQNCSHSSVFIYIRSHPSRWCAAAAASLLLLLLTECVFCALPTRVCVRVSCWSVRYVNARLVTLLYVCVCLDVIKSWWSRLYSGLIDRMCLGHVSDVSWIHHQIKYINVNWLIITLQKRFLPIYVMCLLLNGSVQMIIMWCLSCHYMDQTKM